MTAQELILKSVQTDSIVTAEATDELVAAVRDASEGYELIDYPQGDCLDAWGTDEDGDEWRVRLHYPE